MKILGSVAIVRSSDREGAVRRFAAIFGTAPIHEFPIEGRDLNVSVFPGVSVLSGSLLARDPDGNLVEFVENPGA
jgi:hypothetical protein